MSCWVVPTLAAELWGVSIAHVLEQIRDGLVPSREEHGFVVVDIAPESPVFSTAPQRRDDPPPRTWIARAETTAEATLRAAELSSDEIAALEGATDELRDEVAGELSDDACLQELAEFSVLADEPAMPFPSSSAAKDLATSVPCEDASIAPATKIACSAPQSGDSWPRHMDATPPERRRRMPRMRFNLQRTTPSAVEEPDDSIVEERDDGRPLMWRQVRARVSTTRRRPPMQSVGLYDTFAEPAAAMPPHPESPAETPPID